MAAAVYDTDGVAICGHLRMFTNDREWRIGEYRWEWASIGMQRCIKVYFSVFMYSCCERKMAGNKGRNLDFMWLDAVFSCG